jgi:ankyrin repeat protein
MIKLGRNEPSADEDEENNNNNLFISLYEEFTALEICKILLKRGASPNGNTIYDMRPLHLAIRREWREMTTFLLEAGWLNRIFDEIIFVYVQERIQIFLKEIFMLLDRWILPC